MSMTKLIEDNINYLFRNLQSLIYFAGQDYGFLFKKNICINPL